MKPNAFTMGNKASYDEALRTEPVVTKIGLRDAPKDYYPGGYCWPTLEAAEAWVNARGRMFDFGKGLREIEVYGLILPHGWDIDVQPEMNPEGYWHLLNDARVVPKNTPGA